MSSSSAESASPSASPAANDDDSFAEAYAAENETSLSDASYERPEMLRLAADVTGRRILDAGRGSGPLFAALRVSPAFTDQERAIFAPIDDAEAERRLIGTQRMLRQMLAGDLDDHVGSFLDSDDPPR
jgi:hypothetical protein